MADIRDVAKKARVHFSTVSRVLSRPEVVAPDTRARVLEAIKALGYSPNPVARHLKTRHSGKLLVITPDVTNALFPPVLSGIEEAAHNAGYTVLLGYTQWGDAAREERYVRMMMNREADGIVFISPEIPKAAHYLLQHASRRRKAPVANALSCDPKYGIPSVHVDNEKVGYQAFDFLYSLGHRHLAIISGPAGVRIVRDRIRGATTRAREAGFRGAVPVAYGPLSFEGGRIAAEELLARKPRPTAIFCSKDEMAIGAIAAARTHHLQIPEDLSIMGCDGIPVAPYLHPPLTTMAQPLKEIGETATKLLLDTLKGGVAVPPYILLPHELKVRGSTSPPKRV